MVALPCLTLTLPSPGITFSLCHLGPSGSLPASNTKQVLQIHMPCPTQAVWCSAPNTLKTYSWKRLGRNYFSLKQKNFFPANASSEQRRNAAFGLGRARCFAASGNKRPWLKNACFWGTSNNPQRGLHWLPVSHAGNINPTESVTAQYL